MLKKEESEFVNSLIQRYKNDIQLVSILQDVQNRFSYIPEDIIREISNELGIPVGDFYGVATFYSQFKLKRSGRYVINVCSGTACHVKGSKVLVEHLKEVLNIDAGDTTTDGLFTLEPVNCIGACARAPAMLIG